MRILDFEKNFPGPIACGTVFSNLRQRIDLLVNW